MKKLITIILLVLFSLINYSQTVINMMNPEDAQLILLEIDEKDSADVVIYKTNKKEEYLKWDCMWKFKKWGFSNFAIYIAKDISELKIVNLEGDTVKYEPDAKIFITNNKKERGYKNKNVRLPGIMRIFKK